MLHLPLGIKNIQKLQHFDKTMALYLCTPTGGWTRLLFGLPRGEHALWALLKEATQSVGRAADTPSMFLIVFHLLHFVEEKWSTKNVIYYIGNQIIYYILHDIVHSTPGPPASAMFSSRSNRRRTIRHKFLRWMHTTTLYTARCILHTMYSIRCTVYCILHTRIAYCALYAACSML